MNTDNPHDEPRADSEETRSSRQEAAHYQYQVKTIAAFDKQLKRLARKYPSLKAEYQALIEALESNPQQGTAIGHDCFKIRLAIASKGKGKSGGARVIYYVQVSDILVVLLSIYDKSEQDNISDKDLQALLAKFIY